MSGYLRRLATTGAAYTAASVLSKLIAVALLPVYTRYLSPGDYGAAEVLFATVVAASIFIRFGAIEALLRFFYKTNEDPRAVVSTSFAALFWTATAGALIALPFARPLSEALLDQPATDLMRISIGGLWVLTLYEFLLTIFRLEERARAYFVTTLANVLVTIGLTVGLVVGADEGARGLLLGSYAAGGAFVLGLIWVHRRRLSLLIDRALLRRLLRFGLPTMPAELTLYSLNFIDRIIIVRLVGLAEAGLYALAVKFSQSVNVLVRGFQLAWPPLAYSIEDDREAARFYALVVTWFVAGAAFVVTGIWLLARWIVRALAAPEFFASYEAVGLITAALTLYALSQVLIVILGRTGRTELSLPATVAAMAVNIALNLVLVPDLGIVGAGIALLASYIVLLALMYGFTQRLFPVSYEWSRLARCVGVSAVLIGAGEVLLPTDGIDGLAGRTALWIAFPLLLLGSGFFTAGERRALAIVKQPKKLIKKLQLLLGGESSDEEAEPIGDRGGREGPDGGESPDLTGGRHGGDESRGAARRGTVPEAYEAGLRDEDSRN